MNNWYTALELNVVLAQIANHCAFSLSKDIILQTQPQFKRLIINRQNQQTADAIAYILAGGEASLTGVSDVRVPIEKARKKGLCTIEEMVTINKVNHVVARLVKQKDAYSEQAPLIVDLLDSLFVNKGLINRIDACFSSSYEVLDSASGQLAALRKSLRSIDKSIQEQINEFIVKQSAYLSEPVATFRNDRMVVMVKTSDKSKVKGIHHGESASGQTTFIEPMFALELNNKKQEVLSQIEAEIERICWEITQAIGQDAYALSANVDTLAQLDALFAKAAWGIKNEAFVAKLSQDKNIILQNARHPFIPKEVVVANTITLEAPNHVLLITGSNTGGKTVTVKIIGLFVLCAYSGIPVCASYAEVPLFDQVFADIGDEQSIVQSLSTFSSHIFKISSILKAATDQSLVLLDELGSGTDPDEGEALAIAILDELRARNTTVVATTHFNRLKEIAYQSEHTVLASVEFDVKNLKPTYRYLANTSGQSNALAIAARFEIPEKLLDKAANHIASKKSEQQKLIDQLQLAIEKQQQQELQILKQQQELLKQKEDLLKQHEQFEAKKDLLMQQALLQANEIVQAAILEVDELIKAAIVADQQQAKVIKQQLTQKLVTEVKPEATTSKELVIGDHVRITSSMQIGILTELKGNQATVEISGKRFKVKLDQLEKGMPIKSKKQRSIILDSPTKTTGLLECVIVGLRVEDAKVKVDRYINDCILARASFGTIIHGVGTGVLRQAIKEFLKQHPGVAEVKQAEHHQGGAAATIVTFK